MMRNFSWQRVWAVILRHLYNFYHTWDRIVDAFYWPSIDIIIWGLTISALQKQGGGMAPQIAMILIGVVLWYVLWRGQYEITVNLLEEFWSDNFGNLFSTPLSLAEWTVGLFSLGFLKLFLTVTFTAGVAYLLYAVNILRLGFVLIPFVIALLVMGWAFGLFIAGIFLRFGTSVQTLAWAGGFLLMPFSGTYYPVESLPVWMQRISYLLPSAYIFEGMRQVIITGVTPWDMIAKSLVLDMIFLICALTFFVRSFRSAKIRGLGHIR